jgi:hypothetical protein
MLCSCQQQLCSHQNAWIDISKAFIISVGISSAVCSTEDYNITFSAKLHQLPNIPYDDETRVIKDFVSSMSILHHNVNWKLLLKTAKDSALLLLHLIPRDAVICPEISSRQRWMVTAQ